MEYLTLYYVDKENTKQTFILYENLKWNSNKKNKIYINIKKIFSCK